MKASARTTSYDFAASPGMICSNGPGPMDICPVNGRSCAAISRTDVATPVANKPRAIDDASLLSQCTSAITISSHAACK
jgi:hypothetical protein